METKIIEALLYVQGESGVCSADVKEILELSSIAEARKIMKDFMTEFNSRQMGIFVIQFDDTFKFATIEEVREAIAKLVTIVRKQRLSNAAIETAGIIAYKQPITRGMISDIRGVISDSIVASLLTKGIIQEVGISPTPGNPILYGITNKFYDYFRIKSLQELPKLVEFDAYNEAEDEQNNEKEAFDLFGSQREQN